MFSKATKISLLLTAAVVLSACSNSAKQPQTPQDILAKEQLYQASNNNRALIAIYRRSLQAQEDPLVRYKLAASYYRVGDSRSSALYLKPLLNQQLPSSLQQDVGLLNIQNTLQMKKYPLAVSQAKTFIAQYKNNSEAYNLLGIAYAKMGNFPAARENIEKARTYFINDTKALNNLATVAILEGKYKEAVDLLLPQYLNGVREGRMLHNLVFALVKSGDKQYAKDIITKERLNTSPDSLIEALSKVSRAPYAK